MVPSSGSKESIEDVARRIFGDDPEAIDHWVEYWTQSRERNRKLLDEFERLALVDFHAKRVLDIGCGTGGLGELIGDRTALYVGGDYHFHVLQFARPDKGRCYLQCNGIGLPFPDHRFDYIFAFDVIEHLTGGFPWQLQFLRELRRLIQPLGMVFLTTPNFWYPREGHTGLWGPQFLPAILQDRYIRRRNPGFLSEHQTFSNIRLLSPRGLRRLLRLSGLTFLHDLPCGLDRIDYTQFHPLLGRLVSGSLGWYPHAEFWGILVRRDQRNLLRLKLRKQWYLEAHQPSDRSPEEFREDLDFADASFGHQLGQGWYWHEQQGRGFRWISGRAVCFLQTLNGADLLRLEGYCPWPNHLKIFVDGLWIGEHRFQESADFQLCYLLPHCQPGPKIYRVELRTERTYRSSDQLDTRDLSLMIFRIGVGR